MCGGLCSRRGVARGAAWGLRAASPAGPWGSRGILHRLGPSACPAVSVEATPLPGPPSTPHRGRRHVSAPASPRRAKGL